MTKKKSDLKSYLGYIPIITIAVGLIVSWAKFSVSADNTKTKVDKLEVKVEEIAKEGDEEIKELKDKSNDLESAVKVNKTQQDNIQAQVQQVSEKTDKIYDVLIELKNKKK